MSEWIRLHRNFFDLDWFDKPELLALFMLMLKSASYKECEHYGISLHRGQLVTSLGILSKQTMLSTRTLRTCISRLKEWNLIQTDTCNRHTIVTIVNYDEYDTQDTSSLPQSQTESKTEEKEKKPKEPEKPKKSKEELKADTQKRKKKFYDELVPYVETYGRDMIRNFYNYWSEENKSGSRMRFEQERTWNLNLRLQRWARQQTGYQSKQPSSTALHGSENKDYSEGGW